MKFFSWNHFQLSYFPLASYVRFYCKKCHIHLGFVWFRLKYIALCTYASISVLDSVGIRDKLTILHCEHKLMEYIVSLFIIKHRIPYFLQKSLIWFIIFLYLKTYLVVHKNISIKRVLSNFWFFFFRKYATERWLLKWGKKW